MRHDLRKILLELEFWIVTNDYDYGRTEACGDESAGKQSSFPA